MSLIGLAGLALSFGAVLILMTFSVGLAGSRYRAHNASFVAAIYFMVVGGAAFVISAQNFGLASLEMRFEQVEIIFTLASGPLFFILLHRLLGTNISAPLFVLPALIFVLGAVSGILDFEIRSAVVLQISYTGAVAIGVVGVLGRNENSARQSPKRIVIILLVMMVSIHVAQAGRMVFAQYAISAYIVPTLISLLAVSLAITVINRANLLPGSQRRQNVRPDDLSLAIVSQTLRQDPGLRRPEYRLEDLAASVGARSEILSRLINQQTGRGFVAFVNNERARLACDLLQSPDEQETSIDAIALMVGFKSRSAFYRAFTAVMGVTPGNYRKNIKTVS